VFFAVLSVLVVQHRYRRWRRARRLLPGLANRERAEQTNRLRLEGWRLILMAVSLLAMTGVVFAVFLGVPPTLLSAFRLIALASVLGVLFLSLRL
jgi:hypothetical protein